MKAKGFDIDSLRVASPCHVGWESMLGDARVRHCDSCQLNVFNVAELTANEVGQLVLKREGRLCIRLFRRADGTVITKDCPEGLRAYQKCVAKVAGAALTAILGLFSVSFAQKGDEKPIDASKANIIRTITNSIESELCGVVTDTQGAIVPGARITLRTKGAERTTTSDVGGKYRFLDLPKDVFAITIQVPGFKKYEAKNLTIDKSERVELNIVLETGSHSVQLIGVVSAEDIIETTSPTITKTITIRPMQDLPR